MFLNFLDFLCFLNSLTSLNFLNALNCLNFLFFYFSEFPDFFQFFEFSDFFEFSEFLEFSEPNEEMQGHCDKSDVGHFHLGTNDPIPKTDVIRTGGRCCQRDGFLLEVFEVWTKFASWQLNSGWTTWLWAEDFATQTVRMRE